MRNSLFVAVDLGGEKMYMLAVSDLSGGEYLSN